MTRRIEHNRGLIRSGLVLASAIASLCLGAACAPAASGGQRPAQTSTAPAAQESLSGRVTYLQRVALPPGARIEVALDDVSLADAPATRLGSTTMTTTGENVPIPFTLSYDPAAIRPERSYAVSARISIEGQLRWISMERHAVLTSGHPSDDVTITVRPVTGPPTPELVAQQFDAGAESLVGRWQLQRIDYGNDKDVTPASPERYQIEFGEHGSLIARLDCNRGRGGYKVYGSTLTIDPILATLRACGNDSIVAEFTKVLQLATSFHRTDDRLVLSAADDAGTMHLTRLP